MDLDEIQLTCEEHMEKAVEYLKNELRGMRTGRASTALVATRVAVLSAQERLAILMDRRTRGSNTPADLGKLVVYSTTPTSRSGFSDYRLSRSAALRKRGEQWVRRRSLAKMSSR